MKERIMIKLNIASCRVFNRVWRWQAGWLFRRRHRLPASFAFYKKLTLNAVKEYRANNLELGAWLYKDMMRGL